MSQLDPMSLYNPLEELMSCGRRLPDLSKSTWDSLVVPLADRSNWVQFEEREEDEPQARDRLKTHGKIPTRFGKGDHVIATATVPAADQSFLPLTSGDNLEVISVTEEGFLLAFAMNNRSRQGLVNISNVRKVRLPNLGTPVNVMRKESTVLPRRPAVSVPSTPIADYMNTEVDSQVWYMGCMERPESEKKLKPMPNGTFLVRFSNNRQRYALSISYEGEVKHTVVEQSEEGKYFLDEGFVFNSIVELVNYYKVHNLCESFNSLNTVLKNPYRDCKVFRVIHDFSQEEAKFLAIKKGDILTLVDTVGEDRGWWKGALNNRVGFFPMSYVEELREDDTR